MVGKVSAIKWQRFDGNRWILFAQLIHAQINRYTFGEIRVSEKKTNYRDAKYNYVYIMEYVYNEEYVIRDSSTGTARTKLIILSWCSSACIGILPDFHLCRGSCSWEKKLRPWHLNPVVMWNGHTFFDASLQQYKKVRAEYSLLQRLYGWCEVQLWEIGVGRGLGSHGEVTFSL